MKKHIMITLAAALLAAVPLAQGQEMPEMPQPTKEHEWLQKFAGDWESEFEIYMGPTKEPMEAKGTEMGRMIGGFWIHSEINSEMGGAPFSGLMTLGYNPETKKYIGTWVDSMGSHLWRYEGTVDEAGKVLTLTSEGPCPAKPGQLVKFKEKTEFKSDDHRVFTSQMQKDDGEWVTVMKGEFRKKP